MTKRKKQCTPKGENVCGAWDEPIKRPKGIFLGGITKPEPFITIKELEKICDDEKAEYMPVGHPQDIAPVWNTAILRILIAAKKAARKEK